jgi:hypothetical protein
LLIHIAPETSPLLSGHSISFNNRQYPARWPGLKFNNYKIINNQATGRWRIRPGIAGYACFVLFLISAYFASNKNVYVPEG